ncbi:MAG: hypothetical protein AAF824_18015 [Bacteroidota bacterium]
MRLLLFCLITLLSSTLFCQLPDTLRVSSQSTLSLAFPGKVMVVDIGSQGYIHQKKEEILLLKAISPQARPTSFFVKYLDGSQIKYFSSTITFGLSPKSFIKIEEELGTSQEGPARSMQKQAGEADATPFFPELINFSSATSSLSSLGRQLFSVGHRKGKYTAYVHSLSADEKAIYIRLGIQNRHKLPYQISNLQVEHVGTEIVNRTFNSRKQKLEILDLDMPAEIPANTTEDIFLAIPADIIPYTNSTSSLIIKVLPPSGIGGFKLQLPGKYFMNLNTL